MRISSTDRGQNGKKDSPKLVAREWNQAITSQPLLFQTLLAAQIKQVNDKGSIGHFATQTADKFHGRFNRTASCQKIVHNQDFITRFDGINVDFQLIGAVLQLIGLSNNFTRKLTRFAYRNKADTQPQRYRRAKQEATRFGANYFSDPRIFVALNQQFNAEGVGFRIFQ